MVAPPGNYPDGAYPGVVVPAAYNVFVNTYATNADGSRFIPDPPTLSSNTPGPLKPGKTVMAMVDLWRNCRASTDPQTCALITYVNNAFDVTGCPNNLYNPGMIPATRLQLVYGYVNTGCSGDPRNDAVLERYVNLQYNWCRDYCVNGISPSNTPPKDFFNPYTRFIHEDLASNAYAFSVDDTVANVLLDGDGLIITVGGAEHLPCPKQLMGSPPMATCPAN